MIPANYQSFKGSQRPKSTKSTLIGPADLNETISILIVVRRRPDGPPMPGFDYWQRTAPSARKYLSVKEFAARYGAAQEDLTAVADFTAAGMKIDETHSARRLVAATGTVAQMNAAFAIELKRYDSPSPPSGRESGRGRSAIPQLQRHRGYEGSLFVPRDLVDVIVAVLGLDDRNVTGKNTDPKATHTLTAPLVCKLYGWPTTSIPGQTVGIISGGGYDPNDIALYYQSLNKSLYTAGYYVQGSEPATVHPQIPPTGAVVGNLVAPSAALGTLVTGVGTNSLISDRETNMDICLASTVAQGATIAVYFMNNTRIGWVNALTNAIMPNAGQPTPSVISTSYYFSGGDDAAGLADWGHNVTDLKAMTSYFQDAASVGVTVCVATGDSGTDCFANDGSAHVQYPASDPWILACGGTTVGNVNVPGNTFDEYIWNDGSGATGGGISAFFNNSNSDPTLLQPSYQIGTGIPVSLNDASTGRGIPDVAANGSGRSGYPMFTNGMWDTGGGTSAATPLTAGLIAQLNAAFGMKVGFLNPLLYAGKGNGCRKIAAGIRLDGLTQPTPPRPADNACDGVTGYLGSQAGWDACTGWGVLDFNMLLAALTKAQMKETKETKETKEVKDKERIKDKEIKEKEIIKENLKQELDQIKLIEIVNPPQPGDPLRGGLLPWLQTMVEAQGVDQLARVSKNVEALGQAVDQLRAFIRPEERPTVGEQSLARSAEAKLKQADAGKKAKKKRAKKKRGKG